MIKSLVLFSLLLLSYLPSVSATSFDDAYTYITSSPQSSHRKECFFKMVATNYYDQNDYTSASSAFGIAYDLNSKGEQVELWRTQNWYSFRTYLSRNCESLVRMGRVAWYNYGASSLTGDVAVAFYKKGKLLKKYVVADLINDHQHGINIGYSTYIWDKHHYFGRFSSDAPFYIETTENNVFTFNINTGEVISVAKNRYKHDTTIRKNFDIFLPAAFYKSSEIYAFLHYQGVNSHHKHHWVSSKFYDENHSQYGYYNELARDYGAGYNLITALPLLNKSHIFENDPNTGSVTQKDSREVDYSAVVDKNLNITIRAAQYGAFEEVSALLKFEKVDAGGNYHWTLDRYEITDLWPKRHKKKLP